MKIYTLKTCDTCRKALKWLAANDIAFDNHDIRADGLTLADIAPLVEALGWETALNRRSTTWRGLSQDEKSNIDSAKAIQLIAENPTLMKRPVFVTNSGIIAGFDARAQERLQG